jgi:ubiquinone/menaquinone biosynthesis C-methylase UbiE
MDDLLVGLRAVAESTRVRVLFALSHGEFNVSELTQILGQSQPRVSRHLKLMVEAGLISRHKEGNWVLFRLREEGVGGALSRAIVDMLPPRDESLATDLARLEAIRSQRQEAAAAYFSANAANWQKLRSLYIDEQEVERAIVELLGQRKVHTLIDLGTGTGRMLELLAPAADHAIGIDSSREMLALARANLEHQRLRHTQVRQGELYALPFANATADLIVFHQVLHYLDDPQRALLEARRVLEIGGRLLIVDFAPHDQETLRAEHAHRRLGISAEQMAAWLSRSGLALEEHRQLPPPDPANPSSLTVSLWLASNTSAARRHTAPMTQPRERSIQ